jgi:hypothetical protein
MPINPLPYRGAFGILSRDFERIGEYVEFEESNDQVYSHRLFEILLRSCTEFESICRDILLTEGYDKKRDDMDVRDYATLDSSLVLSSCRVGVLLWQPAPLYLKPFEAWATKAPKLTWYQDYNSVKHNRQHNFKYANLANVCKSMAAVYAILVKTNIIKGMTGTRYRPTPYPRTRECIHPNQIFSFVDPCP